MDSVSQIPIIPPSESSLSPQNLVERFDHTPTQYELVDEEDIKLISPQKYPILFVDINSGNGNVERVIIYEGDTPESISKEFASKHNLNYLVEEKLRMMLEKQMQGVLGRIGEEPFEEED